MFCEMRKRWLEFNVNNAFRKQYFSWREFEIEGKEIQFHDLINFIQIRRSKILVRLLFPQFVKINLQRYDIKSASSLEMIKYIINLALSTCMENNIWHSILNSISIKRRKDSIRSIKEFFSFEEEEDDRKFEKDFSTMLRGAEEAGEQSRFLHYSSNGTCSLCPFKVLPSPLPHFSSSSGVERKNVKLGQ